MLWIMMLISFYSQGYAQENVSQAILQRAVEEYEVGHFERVFDLLTDKADSWQVTMRYQAYRLLALTYLAEDRMEECRIAIRKMLESEPYYTPALQDPLRFIMLVKELQAGKITLVTASQQAESPEEAPVPVTLITEEMLQHIGARTLKDALLAYVPGMNSVESANEVNIAMHGIFSGGQQKILILLNGHRLNCRSTNGAAPDYSIGLEKVKQIEVLRGPASSLYGNVALTAVVNLITKSGRETEGVSISVGAGNYGQKKLDFLYGKRFLNADFMAWATIFASDGQKVKTWGSERIIENVVEKDDHWGDGDAIINGYKGWPSYDVGFIYTHNHFSALLNCRYGKRIDPYASVGFAQGATYTYGAYPKFEGAGIGYGVGNTHSELSWKGNLKNYDIQLTGYFDLSSHNQYTATGDSLYAIIANNNTPEPAHYTITNAFQVVNWREYALGGMGRISREYGVGLWGKGNILLGIQIEQMNMFGSNHFLGRDFSDWFYSERDVVKTGKESIYSLFAQIKHDFPGGWILNAGIRGDLKIRSDQQKIKAFSPRVSFIYIPNRQWNFKLNVARSFVDAPYFYRNNSLKSFLADSLIRPENLMAVQLFYAWHPTQFPLKYEGNFFYNYLTDFIYRMQKGNGDTRYRNAGELHLAGWENTLGYEGKRLNIIANITMLRVLKGKQFEFTGKRIHHIPPVTATWVMAVKVLEKNKCCLWIHWDGAYCSKQLSPIRGVVYSESQENAESLARHTTAAVGLINAGVRMQCRQTGLSLCGYNLTNRKYSQGGSTVVPYRQQGLSVMANLKYSF